MRKSRKAYGSDDSGETYKPCKSYSFSARTICTKSKFAIDALCVFFNASDSIGEGFYDELEAALKSADAMPDCVVIITDTEKGREKFLELWERSDPGLENFLGRGRNENVLYIKSYYFVIWNRDSGFSVECKNEGSGYDFELDVGDIVKKGLANLVESNPVVHTAPAGHVFRHPSKSTNKIFIKSSELAMSEAEIAFVGWCLSHELAQFARKQDLSQVYIDTMGIYPVVRHALNMLESQARIHSYHSYNHFSELVPPLGPYVVVISASTSGDMAKKLCDKQGFEADKIVTLVDSRRESRVGSVIIALEDVDSLRNIFLSGGGNGNETQIELIGEYFLPKSKPPRAVALSVISHNPKSLQGFLSQFGHEGLLDFDAQSAQGSVRMIRLDGKKVGDNDSLLGWLEQEISWCVASAVDHVVYADNNGSKEFAEKAAGKLEAAKGCQGATIKIVAHDRINADVLKEAKGVLVVQAVTGDGGVMRRISRDLREFLHHTIPRHFIIGVGLPQDQGRWDRLQQFLVRNASDRKYGFSVWMKLLVGTDDVGDTWGDLRELLSKEQVLPHSACTGKTSESRALSDELIKKAKKSFVPMSGDSKLKLSEGFAFFDEKFGATWNKVPDSTVYATVASVLQSARDCDNLGVKLKSNSYESVVLDPENFLRFNDGILQVCILRAARKSELDYSSSPDLSRHMKEILIKIFKRHKHVYGEAAIEFAAALACKKMKLTDKDLSEVKKKANESPESHALWGLIDMA